MLTILLQITLGILFHSEPRPIFKPDSLLINYDTIDYASDGRRELYFTNVGDAPLILDVRSSCGCLVPEYPKGPTMPGERNKIAAIYDTKRPGIFWKTLTVKTNEPDSNNANIYVIKVKGYVHPASGVELSVPAK